MSADSGGGGSHACHCPRLIACVMACVHTQKLNRSKSETTSGRPLACWTSSRRYCHDNETPRFGFAFNQCGPSTRQSSHSAQSSEGKCFPAARHFSHGSRPHTNANHVSSTIAPSKT